MSALKVLIAIILGFCLGSPVFAGIGRIGNSSIGSEELGFETTVPQNYPIIKNSGDRVIMQSPFSSSLYRKTDVTASDVSVLAAEWRDYSRDQWKEKIESFSQYIDYIAPESSCVLAARWVNENEQVFGVATWGNGLGVVFSAEGSRFTWDATEHLLKNIQLYGRDCQWN